MYCPKCGRETEQSGKFCQWCGTDLKSAPPRSILRRKVGTVSTDRHAGLGGRFLAAVIDLLFLVLIDFFVIGVITTLAWLFTRPSPVSEAFVMLMQYYRHIPRTDGYGNVVNAVVPTQLLVTAGLLLIIVPWLYFGYLESSKNQATLGKIALRIAVTDMNGNRITFARATLRFFAKIISVLTLFVGFIIIAFTRRKQGLHDIIAGCLMFYQK
ncbi:MAG TPA: RDD family protein [Methanoregulaceae archaeon]|nr:RDD family protein [Methanoregulaceae archaeon]